METNNFNNPVLNEELSMTSPEFGTSVRPRLRFWEAVKTCFAKYATFTGRARRSEYWWFSLFELLIIGLPALAVALGMWIIGEDFEGYSSLWLLAAGLLALFIVLACLAIIIPSISVQVRRLHDTGRSGWWYVWSLVLSIAEMFAEMFAYGASNYFTDDIGTIGVLKSVYASSPITAIGVGTITLANYAVCILIIIFSLFDSQKGANKYGPSPKYQ